MEDFQKQMLCPKEMHFLLAQFLFLSEVFVKRVTRLKEVYYVWCPIGQLWFRQWKRIPKRATRFDVSFLYSFIQCVNVNFVEFWYQHSRQEPKGCMCPGVKPRPHRRREAVHHATRLGNHCCQLDCSHTQHAAVCVNLRYMMCCAACCLRALCGRGVRYWATWSDSSMETHCRFLIQGIQDYQTQPQWVLQTRQWNTASEFISHVVHINMKHYLNWIKSLHSSEKIQCEKTKELSSERFDCM